MQVEQLQLLLIKVTHSRLHSMDNVAPGSCRSGSAPGLYGELDHPRQPPSAKRGNGMQICGDDTA